MGRKRIPTVLDGTWAAWDPSNKVPFDSTVSGMGRGESKLAEELGSISARFERFDVLGDDGRLWEVKELTPRAPRVRPGVSGSHLGYGLMVRLSRLTELLERTDPDVVLSAPRNGHLSSARNTIAAGEICRGLVLGDTKRYPVGLMDCIDAYLSTRAEPTFNETLAAVLKEHAISLEQWSDLVKASDVFTDVDGLAFVNEKLGYSLVEKEKLDEVLEFDCVSQGKPRFKVRKKAS